MGFHVLSPVCSRTGRPKDCDSCVECKTATTGVDESACSQCSVRALESAQLNTQSVPPMPQWNFTKRGKAQIDVNEEENGVPAMPTWDFT